MHLGFGRLMVWSESLLLAMVEYEKVLDPGFLITFKDICGRASVEIFNSKFKPDVRESPHRATANPKRPDNGTKGLDLVCILSTNQKDLHLDNLSSKATDPLPIRYNTRLYILSTVETRSDLVATTVSQRIFTSSFGYSTNLFERSPWPITLHSSHQDASIITIMSSRMALAVLGYR